MIRKTAGFAVSMHVLFKGFDVALADAIFKSHAALDGWRHEFMHTAITHDDCRCTGDAHADDCGAYSPYARVTVESARDIRALWPLINGLPCDLGKFIHATVFDSQRQPLVAISAAIGRTNRTPSMRTIETIYYMVNDAANRLAAVLGGELVEHHNELTRERQAHAQHQTA